MRRLLVALGMAAGFGVCFGQGELLVVTKQTRSLAIVDGASLKVLAQVPIGQDPHEVVVGPDGRTAFVSNYQEATLHTLARVDLIGRKALPPVDVTPLLGAHGLMVHDGKIWFTAEGSKALGVMNAATGKVEAVLGTGQEMTHVVWVSKDGAKVLASNPGSGTMSLFDRVMIRPVLAAGVIADYTQAAWKQTLVRVGEKAEGFAVSPDEKEAWVGNDDGTISVIGLAAEKIVETIPAGVVGANRLKFTVDGGRVLVTTHRGKDLVVIDAASRRVVKRVPIEEKGASGIALEPNGKRAFVACPRDHFVAVVDLWTLERVATIEAGREPDGLAWWNGQARP